MADVTTTFAAKDESFAQTVDRLNTRLAGFQQTVADFSGKVGNMASAFGGFATKIGTVAAAFLGAQSAVQTFKQAIDVGGQLAELSARTGETAGNLAVLQRAFVNAGSSG
jgi:2-methylaconitate cis-trans-isomerase PrpF